jgi:hypothetical protein
VSSGTGRSVEYAPPEEDSEETEMLALEPSLMQSWCGLVLDWE